MAMFAYFVITMIISMVLSYSATRKYKSTQSQNLELDENSFPTATEDKNWQLVYGTVLMEGLNCTWYGDYKHFKIKQKIKQPTMFGSKKVKQEVANGFKAGFKLALGYGTIELKELKFEDKVFLRTKDATKGVSNSTGVIINYLNNKDYSFNAVIPQTFRTYRNGNQNYLMVDNKNFFGSYYSEGGIYGNLTFNSGNFGHLDDDYIKKFTPENKLFNNKNQSYILFKDFYYGNRKQLPKVSALVSRYPFYNDKLTENITKELMLSLPPRLDGSCSPISIILDLLLNPLINDNYKTIDDIKNDIDIDSFKNAEQILFEESFGLSLCLTQDSVIEDILKDVLDEIEGSLYFNPKNGKLSIKLSRQKYLKDDLFIIDDKLIKSFDSITTNSNSDVINQLKLTYSDYKNNYDKRILIFNNDGNYYETKNTNSKSISKLNINNEELASQLLIREIRPLTQQVIRAELVVNRACRHLRNGDVVILNSPRNKIENMVMRVLTIDLGGSNTSEIKIDLMQDLFGDINEINSELVKPEEHFNENELLIPDSINIEKSIEAPFFLSTAPTELIDSNNNIGQNILFISRYNQDTESAKLYKLIDYNTPTEKRLPFMSNDVSFSAITSLSKNIRRYDDIIKINNIIDGVEDVSDQEMREGYNLAVIIDEMGNEEFISYSGYNITRNELYGIKRGLLDTIPKNFNKDSKIYFIDTYYNINDLIYLFNDYKRATIYYDSYSLDYETVIPNRLNGTFGKSYRLYMDILPSNLKINGIPFDDVVNIENINNNENSIVNFSMIERSKRRDLIQFFDDIVESKSKPTLRVLITGGDFTYSKVIDDYTFDVELPNNIKSFDVDIYAGKINDNTKSFDSYNFKIERK